MLKFGTSVFHAHVHQWACQLQYNPRLNEGWGMSDGEGLERIWSFLSPLISQLRYSTKNHRLSALDLRSQHHNEHGKISAIRLLYERGQHIQKINQEACDTLQQVEQRSGHTLVYLKGQWERQRQQQLQAMDNGTETEMMKQVEDLVVLEDKLFEAQQEMQELQRTRRRTHTVEQGIQIEQLPNTLISLESKIDQLIGELGSDYFRNLTPNTTYSQAKALIKLKITKSKLYEAKVGVIEMQKRWDARGSGTRLQAQFRRQMSGKMKHLKNKWASYNHRANDYNTKFTPEIYLPTPTLDEVKAYQMDHAFWSIGLLDHPHEPWAADTDTQQGIQAYLLLTHTEDELRRISREARQAVEWAIQKGQKLQLVYQVFQIATPQSNLPQQRTSNYYFAVNYKAASEDPLPNADVLALSLCYTTGMESEVDES
ncbi:uncharacterized protein PGTG_07718 [Puccinia graminis f. sp. tritici CRL 75-36-700-3]|uniref:Uncharacterized protein n=1 Tax=Puccinia graminis f. sp. tritici (strain CRL 75-36-700-3 / race SCCL) TaxID=418459 RepID=E3KDC1_PUCGT|nr:uncharacterized protein PGTG_07718 [Puccinia graminis f. sp. tritici CRL 75-36-700-3]EFP82321.2 hypothetical protein PGTG_07718 [Puccinia graminis f. sp. tritici CRL 75-36-700-3]